MEPRACLKKGLCFLLLIKSYNKFRDDYIHALQLTTNIEGKHISFQVHRMVYYYCFVEPFDLNDKDIVIKVKTLADAYRHFTGKDIV